MENYFDIINNEKCPFCKTDLVDLYLEDVSLKYKHAYCNKNCIKVMTNRLTQEWVLIRVYLNKDASIEINKRNIDKKLLYVCFIHDKQSTLSFPYFNIFAGSLSDLERKIKKYLLFT